MIVGVGTIASNALYAAIPALIGTAFGEVLGPPGSGGQLLTTCLWAAAAAGGACVIDLGARFASELLAKRVERDCRDELYIGLLGKSLAFHGRHQVGDVVARATSDANQISWMVMPGLDNIWNGGVLIVMALVFVGALQPQLLLAPVLFVAAFGLALRVYVRQLTPVAAALRQQLGAVNAGLMETIAGIDTVWLTGQEARERRRFEESASRYRDLTARMGRVQAGYAAPLLLAAATALAFLHGLALVALHRISLGDLVAYMGLLGLLAAPTASLAYFSSLVQLGLAAAGRILALLNEETELDDNEGGHRARIAGEIVFDRVTFGYGETPVLRDVSFRVEPGQTVAIVGQTGSGKTTLTRLVNRIHDAGEGRVLVDGVDVRAWSLEALRSQVSTIDQDTFLFSRSVAENIAFGGPDGVEREAIELAAADAQAHEFIAALPRGYETVLGERGVTLSGGQRQRLAIARALLAAPRILIVDDSTSAVDSATEDRIQRALRRVARGRTTLLITHRLAQIRAADRVLVLRRGELLDQGTHDELLTRCALYRRLFHQKDLPPPVGGGSGWGP